MRAELARTGWIIAAAGLALGATFAVRQHASQPQATPAVVPREVAAVAVDTDTSVRLPGDVWYVSHDLDGDGRPELIARDQHTV
ncbi:MAG TPA: hypothetical protein VLX92_13345, partial [Kofleriaceae bacterium]|nr:hypothetical protein [Kofleriaceae bacterium]